MSQATAADYQISAEQWASPRSGQSVASMPPLPEVVSILLAKPKARVMLYHPGGDEGQIWALELRDWLVALGIESRRVELQAGNPDNDAIAITIKN